MTLLDADLIIGLCPRARMRWRADDRFRVSCHHHKMAGLLSWLAVGSLRLCERADRTFQGMDQPSYIIELFFSSKQREWRISTGLLAVVILGWYALSIRVVSVRPSFVHGSVCCRLFIVLVVCPLVYPWKFPLKWGVSKMRALRQLRPRVCCCFGGCYYCCCFCFLWQSKHAILRDSAIGFWAGPA